MVRSSGVRYGRMQFGVRLKPGAGLNRSEANMSNLSWRCQYCAMGHARYVSLSMFYLLGDGVTMLLVAFHSYARRFDLIAGMRTFVVVLPVTSRYLSCCDSWWLPSSLLRSCPPSSTSPWDPSLCRAAPCTWLKRATRPSKTWSASTR